MGQLTITPEGYVEIKGKIKEKLNETANNFIIIGYYMKQVRDSGAYIQDGYRNIEEFAQGEYRLSASTASRFMDINTKFSLGGNSMQIKEEFQSFGYSKLQEMLTVKEDDIELITEDATVAQIRELKRIEKEEEKAEAIKQAQNLPLVRLSAEQQESPRQEPLATSQEPEYSQLQQTLIALYKTKDASLLAGIRGGMITGNELAEELSPSGSRTFTHNAYMLFMYTAALGVKFRYYADGKANVETYSYEQLIEISNDFITDELFEEITHPAPEPKPTPAPPVERPSEDVETDSYKPLPGQMSLTESEMPHAAAGEPKVTQAMQQEPADAPKETVAKPQETVEAEYRELEQSPAAQGEYTPIEIDNAIGYFEIEYSRMMGMGTSAGSVRCRNYKIALDAIKKVYKE